MSRADYDAYLIREQARKPASEGDQEMAREAVLRETGPDGLHSAIIRHCRAQWPPWKYIHSRTDQRSTVDLGVADFVILLPGGRTVYIECKTKTGKLSEDQMGWALQAKMLGHIVHVVRSMPEFLEIVK